MPGGNRGKVTWSSDFSPDPMHKTNIILSVAAVLSLSVVLPAQQLAPKTQATPEGLTAGQWTSIRAAYEAGRHAVSKVDGTYQARNPGQGWLTRFEDGGFEVKPDAGAWTWGLKLKSYGFVGHEQEVSTPSEAQADGGRMSYRWDALLEEWFLNDTRGLEHGYTVHQRPSRDAGDTTSPLTFTLAVRGGLSPQITGDQRGVRFVDSNGGTALTYTGLTVFDADGKDVPARFERRGDLLRLLVEEADARYPLTIDPIVRQAYLKASNTDAGDYFGCSVSISGDTVVVGAPYEASNAKGVNRDQSDNSAARAGAAYVFVRSAGTWTQQAYLKASNTDAYDFFGQSVSISGDTVVVGARFEDSNATGVNGDQSNNSARDAGAAYVFVRSAGTWAQQAYLKASNTDVGDFFGSSVSISGDTVVVGAPWESSDARGVNGNQSNNSISAAGAAYVFVRGAGTWTQRAYLKASNTDWYDYFGRSVSISGDTVVIGAIGEESLARGVNGNQGNHFVLSAGAAYVFHIPRCRASSTSVGTGCIASGTPPSLVANPPVQGKSARLSVRSSLPSAVGVIVLGIPHKGIPLGATCTAYLDITLPTLPIFFSTDAAGGWLSRPIAVSRDPSLTCVELALQAAIENPPTAPLGLALSNGVWVKVGY